MGYPELSSCNEFLTSFAGLWLCTHYPRLSDPLLDHSLAGAFTNCQYDSADAHADSGKLALSTRLANPTLLALHKLTFIIPEHELEMDISRIDYMGIRPVSCHSLGTSRRILLSKKKITGIVCSWCQKPISRSSSEIKPPSKFS